MDYYKKYLKYKKKYMELREKLYGGITCNCETDEYCERGEGHTRDTPNYKCNKKKAIKENCILDDECISNKCVNNQCKLHLK